MTGGRSPLPSALLRFVERFNRGAYWESHEVLEGPWRRGRSGFYHGLILFASAFVHVRRGNPHGIDAQLRKAEGALAPYRPAYLGVDVDALLAHAECCRRCVATHRGTAAPEAWPGLIPPITLVPDPDRIRGDEPELVAD